MKRCAWVENTFDQYYKYHDEEWGVPVHDDRTHFEFIVLESAQAGLSWSTVLRKREGYREAFAGFDPVAVAAYTDDMVETLMQNPDIIRNRLKINAAINNARKFLEIQSEFGSFDSYIWKFVDGKPVINHWQSIKQVPASTSLSDEVSKDLKRRGFKFVGTTIVYAHLQATGVVMDHTVDCFRHAQLSC